MDLRSRNSGTLWEEDEVPTRKGGPEGNGPSGAPGSHHEPVSPSEVRGKGWWEGMSGGQVPRQPECRFDPYHTLHKASPIT